MKGNPFISDKFLLNYTIDEIKQLLDDYWWKLPPTTVEIDPTNLCNNACIWCMYHDFREIVPESITLDEMKSIIKQLSEFGVRSITFTGGGEPLCNKDVFPQAFHLAKAAGLQVGLVTNGMFLGDYVKDIAETCRFVRVSLDAGTAKTHAYLHGVPEHIFNDVLKNIQLLVGKVDTGLAFLVHPDNYTEVEKFCKIGASLGVSYVEVRPVLMPGLTLSNKIVDSVMEQLQRCRERNKNLKVFCRLERFEEVGTKTQPFSICLGTPLVGVISADMNVSLCCQWRGVSEYNFGNLKEQSFKDIWYGEKRRKIVESIDVSKCTPCRYRGYNRLLENLKCAEHIEFL